MAGGSTPDSGDGLIAYTVPADTQTVTIWLRASGSGGATIGPISLRPLKQYLGRDRGWALSTLGVYEESR